MSMISCSNQTVAGLKYNYVLMGYLMMIVQIRPLRDWNTDRFRWFHSTTTVQIRPLRDWNRRWKPDESPWISRSNQTVAGLKYLWTCRPLCLACSSNQTVAGLKSYTYRTRTAEPHRSNQTVAGLKYVVQERGGAIRLKFKSDRCGIEIRNRFICWIRDTRSNQTVAGLK